MMTISCDNSNQLRVPYSLSGCWRRYSNNGQRISLSERYNDYITERVEERRLAHSSRWRARSYGHISNGGYPAIGPSFGPNANVPSVGPNHSSKVVRRSVRSPEGNDH